MYLSQLILNPRSRQVQREIGNPYELHRTLMRAFPSKEAGGPGRVLFRLEAPRNNQPGLVLLVQSELEPDWAYFDERSGYLLSLDRPNLAYKAFDPRFRPGQSFHFRLRANPTKRLFRDDPERKL
ncbi:MAG: type I-E CRISPR-associated protein Cas6/Cse3/CasE, partial [Anaerolineae bacterium]